MRNVLTYYSSVRYTIFNICPFDTEFKIYQKLKWKNYQVLGVSSICMYDICIRAGSI